MNQDEFLRAFEELLEMPAGSLTGGEKLDDLEHWDSVAMVSFMAMADEKCGAVLSPRRIAGANTVEDLYQLAKAA